jgi:type II secretory pathway predicted ATPase ExeA
MIRSFFNLKDLPFKKNIGTELLFKPASFKEGLSRLEYIKSNPGFMLITGDSGTGKTSLLRSFVASINSNYYQHFYIPLATVSIVDFYRQLNSYLNGVTVFRKAHAFSTIQEGIKNMVKNYKKVPIIIFDESHLLKNDNFFELQIIFNFEFDSISPAIVIIIGQSHLRDRLSRDILYSFRRRISLKYHLLPLPKEETVAFIVHSLSIVGGSKNLFSDSALEAIYNNTQGNLGIISSLALKALFACAYDNQKQVTEEHVFQASKEI